MTTSAQPHGERTRLDQLDAVRGALAFGVVAFHVLPSAPIGLGTFGVYAFFVLSGVAMELTYGSRLRVRPFVVARVARLAPLWIPVVILSAARSGIDDPARILLNLTGLFGFIAPGATSAVTGGWSIGIEVVCYAAFAVLASWRLSTPALAVLAVGAMAVRSWYVDHAWPSGSLETSWVAYTQAPSFLGFFVGGMVGARVAGTLSGPLPFLMGSGLLAIGLTFGDPRSTAGALLITGGVIVMALGRPWRGRARRVARLLGDLSYGTYLLHPLVAAAVGPLALLVTPPLALAVHRVYEAPAGRRIRQLGGGPWV